MPDTDHRWPDHLGNRLSQAPEQGAVAVMNEGIGAALTPFEDAFAGLPLQTFYNPEKEKMRQAVNEWLRQGGAYDGVIDFDAAVSDPQQTSRIDAEYDGGDHLHQNDAGYKAMGDAVDLKPLSGH